MDAATDDILTHTHTHTHTHTQVDAATDEPDGAPTHEGARHASSGTIFNMPLALISRTYSAERHTTYSTVQRNA